MLVCFSFVDPRAHHDGKKARKKRKMVNVLLNYGGFMQCSKHDEMWKS